MSPPIPPSMASLYSAPNPPPPTHKVFPTRSSGPMGQAQTHILFRVHLFPPHPSPPSCGPQSGIPVSDMCRVTKLPSSSRGHLGEKPGLDRHAACTAAASAPPWSSGSGGRDVTTRGLVIPVSSLQESPPSSEALLLQGGLQC